MFFCCGVSLYILRISRQPSHLCLVPTGLGNRVTLGYRHTYPEDMYDGIHISAFPKCHLIVYREVRDRREVLDQHAGYYTRRKKKAYAGR